LAHNITKDFKDIMKIYCMEKSIRIGLAQLMLPHSVSHGIDKIIKTLEEGASKGVDIICFPESYIPGLRNQDFEVPDPSQAVMEEAVHKISEAAASSGVAAIVGMEWETEIGLHNIAVVISNTGDVMGYQAKNQIPPGEDKIYVPDGKRKMFTVKGATFGIAICHEGWRYPESVRWAAVRGAHIVFHPHYTGSDQEGITITEWGSPSSPYFEKAMITRSIENTIYFASVNYALKFQQSATTLLSPWGECIAYVPYGEEAILVEDIDLSEANGFFAKRYNPELYPD
jgi:predicted amidohydrolase